MKEIPKELESAFIEDERTDIEESVVRALFGNCMRHDDLRGKKGGRRYCQLVKNNFCRYCSDEEGYVGNEKVRNVCSKNWEHY